MRRMLILSLSILVAFSVLVSCETTRSLTSKLGSITGRADEDLFAQVPEHEKGDFDKATLALMVSEGKVKLSEMKTELATVQMKYAGYEEDVAKKLKREAELAVDIAKLQAIDRSGLGNKDDNAEKIADLRSKKLQTEAQRVKIEAQLATAKRRIRDLTQQIEEQTRNIEELETGGEAQRGKQTTGQEQRDQ